MLQGTGFMVLLELFTTFFKIGMFTFGGGYAMIPIIENICVEERKWITHEEMMNLTVVAESTPGPIAINLATYIGYQKHKLLGSVIATLGMVLPSFIIIYLFSIFLDNFLEITIVSNALKGIKIAVGILIVDASYKMFKKMSKKPLPLLIFTASFIVMMLTNIFAINFSSIYLMLIMAFISLFAFTITKRRETK